MKKQDKILLATVNSKKINYAVTADEFSAIAPNIQLGLLSAYVKSKGIPLEVIDGDMLGLSHDELIDRIEEIDPAVVGFVCTGANPSSSTMTMAGLVDFYVRFNERKPPIKNFIWGAHPTVLPKRSLDETNADFVVRGEGYDSIVDLYHCLRANDS